MNHGQERFGDQMAAFLERQGFCLVRGVPATEEEILRFAGLVGSSELGIDEELSGPPVMNLRYDGTKAITTERPAYFTNGEFPLHSDLTYVENPPRWLLTLCVRPDAAGGGVIILSDCRMAWSCLSRIDHEILERFDYSFLNAPNTGKGLCTNRAIHEHQNGQELCRFRTDTLVYPESSRAAVASFTEKLRDNQIEFEMRAGDLVIVDNHRILHGRTGFDIPSERSMLRCYAGIRTENREDISGQD